LDDRRHPEGLTVERTPNEQLDSRLTTAAWGLFFIMAGGILLIPDSQVPSGAWGIGIGVIMIGLNVVRAAMGLKTSLWTIGLGTVALLVGLTDLAGVDLPVFALLLIVLGAVVVLRAAGQRT
jgi:hypothetical protein